ncbi:MAG: hypothetical protein VX498_12830 [Myxococcota bacterium]|nr:hypothetical protein [Myxococcota bacterium]
MDTLFTSALSSRRKPLRPWPGIREAALLILVSVAGFSGCAPMNFAGSDDLANPEVDEARGQMILFVGTDPANLRTDLYLAQSTHSGLGGSFTEADGPDLVEAEAFQIENLTSPLDEAVPTLAAEGLALFAGGAPFPVPDRTGTLIALLALGSQDNPSPNEGRVVLMDVDGRNFTEGPTIPGLLSARFTWNGAFLVVEHTDPEQPTRTRTSLVSTLAPEMGSYPAVEDPELDVEFAGLERGSNRVLLEVRDSEGRRDILLLDPDAETSTSLTETIDAAVSDAALSPDGSRIALTVTDPNSGTRSVIAYALEDGPEGAYTLGPMSGQECFWPVWQPPREDSTQSSLACVCQHLETERPDIVLWNPDATDSVETLTAGPQPNVFDGTMTGLTVRSRPQWGPGGKLLVFGASTREEALDGEAMTLVTLPLDSSAYPVFTAAEGSSDWAHFSAASEEPHLLVWDRGESGLQDSIGRHPIQVVIADQPEQAPHPVVLGRNLFVAYPQYLGANTMLYP